MNYTLLYVKRQIKHTKENICTVCRVIRFSYKYFIVSIITTNRYSKDDSKADKITERWTSMCNYKVELETRCIFQMP
jgi:hypothetical protein